MPTLTDSLAVWGAVVGTVSLLWNLRRDKKDAARVSVRVFWGITGFAGTEAHLSVLATNTGRRQIVLTNWGITKLDTEGSEVSFEAVPASGEFPRKLDEGEQALFRGADDVEEASKDLRRAWVQDSTGKMWYASGHEMRRLLDDVPEILGVQKKAREAFRDAAQAAVRKFLPDLAGGDKIR